MSTLKNRWTRTLHKSQVPVTFWSLLASTVTTSLIMQEYLLGRQLAGPSDSVQGLAPFLRQVLPGAERLMDEEIFDPVFLESFRTGPGVYQRFTYINNAIQAQVHEVIFGRYDRVGDTKKDRHVTLDSFLKTTLIYHNANNVGGGNVSGLWMKMPDGFQLAIDNAMHRQVLLQQPR